MDRMQVDAHAAGLGAEIERLRKLVQYLAEFFNMSDEAIRQYIAQNGGPRAQNWALQVIDQLDAARGKLDDEINAAARDLEATKERMASLELQQRPLPGSAAERTLAREVEQAETAVEDARHKLFRLEQARYSASWGDIPALLERAKEGRRVFLETAIRADLEWTAGSDELRTNLREGRQRLRYALARLGATLSFRAEVERVVGPLALPLELVVADHDELEAVTRVDHYPELRPVRAAAAATDSPAFTDPAR